MDCLESRVRWDTNCEQMGYPKSLKPGRIIIFFNILRIYTSTKSGTAHAPRRSSLLDRDIVFCTHAHSPHDVLLYQANKSRPPANTTRATRLCGTAPTAPAWTGVVVGLLGVVPVLFDTGPGFVTL